MARLEGRSSKAKEAAGVEHLEIDKSSGDTFNRLLLRDELKRALDGYRRLEG